MNIPAASLKAAIQSQPGDIRLLVARPREEEEKEVTKVIQSLKQINFLMIKKLSFNLNSEKLATSLKGDNLYYWYTIFLGFCFGRRRLLKRKMKKLSTWKSSWPPCTWTSRRKTVPCKNSLLRELSPLNPGSRRLMEISWVTKPYWMPWVKTNTLFNVCMNIICDGEKAFCFVILCEKRKLIESLTTLYYL